MLSRALWFLAKDGTRTGRRMISYAYARRKRGAEQARREARPTLGGAAQPGSPRRRPGLGFRSTAPGSKQVLLYSWALSAFPLVVAQ